MLSDIEIAQSAELKPIAEIANQLGISADELEFYGKYKAKLSDELADRVKDNPDGKLILVTAINPTPAGEGKTTTSAGLGQAMAKIGKKAIIALREPSLGPVFGIKGGAAGGGYAQVLPMEDINLHFTGDMHAITAANNLCCAMLDNHIQQGNTLGIDPRRILFKRCLDMNDRALRNITIGLGGKVNGVPREDHFIITVASEVMAILCLANDISDLKERLGNILVAYTYSGEPVYAKNLKAEGAMTALLKDAIKPNLVQTLEGTPAIMHGGPFANIAHGCNSIRATKLALKLINGNVYYPTKIGPDDSATSAKTNLSTAYETDHYIGDSTGMCPYMDASFSIPATEVTAVGTQIDTTKLSDGEHTLKVTNGESTKEVTFIVDNKAPEIDLGVEDGSVLSGNLTFGPKVIEDHTLDTFVVTLDGEQINNVYETTAYSLGDGQHIISAFAKDAAGNETTKTAVFTVDGTQITITAGGTTDITDNSASLYLNVSNVKSDTKATFYKAEKIDTDSIKTNTLEGILPYIQYTVNVADAKDDEMIVADWDGKASNNDGTHAETMYVLNTANGEWDEIAKADSNGTIKDAAFTVANHVKNSTATIIVQCTADSALPELDTVTDGKLDNNADWDGTTVPKDYDFCFAWETDTQYYAEEWQNHFLNINNWIVNNAEERKIKYVIHTGDIVDDVDMTYEWENADEAMGILDKAGMSYGVLGGNHDVAAGLADYENYYKYFGENRFKSQNTYGESYKNNKGHYDLISEGGQDFIIVYMSWNIYQEEIDWMNQVLQQYSDRKAILCFHTYTNVKQSSGTYLDYYGQLVQKNVVAKNPNVFAVLNGHYHGSSYETVMFDDDGDGKNDRTVYQICTDYQSGFEGGNEYIKFLYFDLDNNKIYMNSYSPCMDDFNYYDTDVHTLNVEGASATGVDEMVLDVEFNTNEQTILEKSFNAYVYTNEEIGTANVDSSTGKAVLQVNNLEANTGYKWYAVVTNAATGVKRSGVYEFTTAKKNTDVITDDSQDTSDKSGNIIATGDNARIWVYILVGMSAIAVGIVSVKKKKEA